MPRYRASFRREYVEYGEVEFEADSLEEAQDTAADMEAGDWGDIEWSTIENESGYVESVEEVD